MRVFALAGVTSVSCAMQVGWIDVIEFITLCEEELVRHETPLPAHVCLPAAACNARCRAM